MVGDISVAMLVLAGCIIPIPNPNKRRNIIRHAILGETAESKANTLEIAEPVMNVGLRP